MSAYPIEPIVQNRQDSLEDSSHLELIATSGNFTIPDSTTARNPHSLMGLLKKLELRGKSRDRILGNVARF